MSSAAEVIQEFQKELLEMSIARCKSTKNQRAESPSENPLQVSLRQSSPQCLRTCQAIKISTRPPFLGRACQSQVWGKATSHWCPHRGLYQGPGCDVSSPVPVVGVGGQWLVVERARSGGSRKHLPRSQGASRGPSPGPLHLR